MNGLAFTRFISSVFVASALIGIILLVKNMLKSHISIKWQYNMSLLFLAVLVMPFIPIGYFNFEVLYSPIFGNTLMNGNLYAISTGSGMNSVFSGSDWLQDFTLSVNRSTPEYVCLLLFCIWLVGVFVYTVITVISNQKIQQIKKTAHLIENKELKSIFEQYKIELKITGNLMLCESHLIQAPAAVGILKTLIVLPPKIVAQMPSSNIKYVIMHELHHYKSKDLLINYVMCLLQILYWFNPLVYLAFKEMRMDREIACDASVLKMLDKRNYIDYGMTIIDFAEKLSQPAPLTLAAGMGGSKRQITKRIEKIASFTEDSTRLKIKSVGIFALVSLLVLSQIPVISAMALDNGKYNFIENENTSYEDLSTYFDGFAGSFVLYDLQENSYIIYNKDKSVTRVSPDSTYKIYSALIGLELDVIQNGNSTLRWDGTNYPFEQWNKDHDLHSAMKDSVSWYFQDIDKLSGEKELQRYFENIGYGNYDLSSGLSDYWMESSLLISPIEQVRLLKDFYLDEIAFKRENIEAVKNTLKLSVKDGAVLSGKTGTGAVNGSGVNGWFIGYVEKDDHAYIFAANIQGKNGASGSVAAQIALSILSDKGIY